MRPMCVRVLLLLTLAFPTLAAAQAPGIGQVAPRGWAPGQTVTVKVTGSNLAGTTQLWTSFGEPIPLSKEIPENADTTNGATFQVAVPDSAPPGIQGVRIVTDKGVSPLYFIVLDPLPVIAHNNQNKSSSAAQEVTLPCAVEGHVDNLSRLYFKFTGAAEQRVSFEVQARRIGSALDPVMRLFDPNGREIDWSDDEPGLQGDCQMAVTLPSAGEYRLELSDIRYQGGGNHRFRLRIGDFALVNTAYPMVIQSSVETTYELAGHDLAGRSGGKLLFSRPESELNPPILWVGINPLRADAATSSIGPDPSFALFGVSPAAQFRETEPNDAPEQANRIELGQHVNGRSDQPDDVDRFVFAAKAGQNFRFEATTRQAGSPTDLLMQIFKPDGGKLVEAEDVGLEDGAFDFNCPADGDYTLVVRDLHRRGGPEFAYHISIDPNRPAFKLNATADVLNVPAGGTLAMQITAARRGYNGTIRVEARNLPEGVASVPTFIGPGRNDAILTLTATKEAAAGQVKDIDIVGSAEIDGATVHELATIHESLKGANNALPWPPRNLIHTTVLAIAPEQTVRLSADPGQVVLGQDLSATVKIVSERKEGWGADIALAVNPPQNGLPPGVGINVQPIKAETNEIVLTVTANNQTPLGEFTIGLTGTIKKENETAVVPVPGISLVVKAPLSVAADPAGGKITKGGELKLAVTIERNPALAAPVTLTAANLPKGVTADAVTIAPDQTTAEFVLKAAADAEAATVNNLQIKAEAAVGDKKFAANSANLPLTVE